MVALPLGIISALLLQLSSWFGMATTKFDPVLLIVQNPLPSNLYSDANSVTHSFNWMDSNFIVGFISALFILVGAAMIIRLVWSYYQLKKLHSSLVKEPLSGIPSEMDLANRSIEIAFHDHPLVPFTFGWKTPIIVLPNAIRNDDEKLNMAIQHELVHIKRGDYLLQLVLSVIESLFWFHPLIRLSFREIETFREISCDQEVLSTTEVSPKNYANMLIELVPLNKGIGAFSISMAVKQSTLKQRIETMKYHKLYKTSYKKSLFFLLIMTLIVVAPIACSDMRGPNTLSEEELAKEFVTIQNLKLEVNGMEVSSIPNLNSRIPGLGSIILNAEEYGTFVIALNHFNGAMGTGEINDNLISFKVNELQVDITSSDKILTNNNSTEIWISHFPNMNINQPILSLGTSNVDYEELIKNETATTSPTDVDPDGEYFIVVEEMPKLIGGLVGLQSKVQYPKMAARAGIEGRVTIQFIVNESGDVENPRVISGIGGGCDEEALKVISEAKFEPGIQRGRPARVQYSIPIVFRLNRDAEFTKD
tara:strand:- start:1566 stop:3170 length:1605 start_codon:yes stop_codon:yes gene_type:complete